MGMHKAATDCNEIQAAIDACFNQCECERDEAEFWDCYHERLGRGVWDGTGTRCSNKRFIKGDFFEKNSWTLKTSTGICDPEDMCFCDFPQSTKCPHRNTNTLLGFQEGNPSWFPRRK